VELVELSGNGIAMHIKVCLLAGFSFSKSVIGVKGAGETRASNHFMHSVSGCHISQHDNDASAGDRKMYFF
jgi:hypothetical protein